MGTIVVVGAGLSGLVCARDLVRGGRDVVVLESADRVGGRSSAVSSSLGSRLDLGGQWIGHDHHRLVALADALGLTRYPAEATRLPHLLREGRRVSPAAPSAVVAGAALGVLGAVAVTGLPTRVRDATVATALRDDDGVVVRTATDGIRAARVVVTVPPPLAAHIAHTPPLPPDHVAIEETMYMGSVHKGIAVYKRPFWRDRGPAEALLLDTPGAAVFDCGPPGGPGHLVFLAGGDDARGLAALDAEDRRARLLRPLAPVLGDAVLTPVDWHEKAWQEDEHAGGGYVALPTPDAPFGYPPVPADPVGRVHWAGTETASEHPGYLDGAIESGERAATEVLRASA